MKSFKFLYGIIGAIFIMAGACESHMNTQNDPNMASLVLNLPFFGPSSRSLAVQAEDRISQISAYHICISDIEGKLKYDEIKPVSSFPLIIDKLSTGETAVVITALAVDNTMLAEGVNIVNLIAGKNDVKITLAWKHGSESFGGIFAYEGTTSLNIIDYNGPGGAVIIPDTIAGIPVTGIGPYAFMAKGITNVTLPKNISTIDKYAFTRNQIISVVIPESTVCIGDYAFCENRLSSIVIPGKVTSIGNAAFYLNPLTNISINNGVTSIGSAAFASNNLTSITIPESVVYIGDWAFNSDQLSSITIGNNVDLGNNIVDYFNGDGSFVYVYNITYGKAAGTYTRSLPILSWYKQ